MGVAMVALFRHEKAGQVLGRGQVLVWLPWLDFSEFGPMMAQQENL